MTTRACPNAEVCGGELEFDWETEDAGDGVWFMSWTVAVFKSQTCKCELSEEVIGSLEEQVTKDGYDGDPGDDYDYDDFYDRED